MSQDKPAPINWDLYRFSIDHVPKGHVINIMDQRGDIIRAVLVPSGETVQEFRRLNKQERGY